MFCPKCGTEVKEDSKFCPKCGASLTGEPQVHSQHTQSTQDNQTHSQIDVDQMKNSITQFTDKITFVYDTKMNIIGLVAAGLFILSTILPYASISLFGVSQSQTLLSDGNGFLLIIVAAAGAYFAYVGKNKPVFFVGIVAILVMLYNAINFASKYGDYIDKGFGFYLMVLGALALIAAGPVWCYLEKNKKI